MAPVSRITARIVARRLFDAPFARRIYATDSNRKGSIVIIAFRKVLMAVAFVAGLSASAVISAQVVSEVNLAYHQLEA